MRPFVEKMTDTEAAEFSDAYDHALGAAYPPRTDRSVLMPFRRVFFVLQV
jgi:trans-aconitate 2-methyltransferase